MSDITDPTSDMLAAQCGLDPQPDPIINDHPSAHDLVIKDLNGLRFMLLPEKQEPLIMMYFRISQIYSDLCEAIGVNASSEISRRKEFGLRKYGTILQPFNGRNHIRDAVDEIGDALVYIRSKLFEEHNPSGGDVNGDQE